MFHIPHGRARAVAFSHLSPRSGHGLKSVFVAWFLLLGIVAPAGLTGSPAAAQDTVTGAFEGAVTNSATGAIISGAAIQIINQQTGQTIPKTSDSRGRFYAGLLAPGIYLIRVSAAGFQTKEVRQRLFITRTGEIVPIPVALDPAPAVAPASPTPAPLPQTEADTDVRARVNASDARQGGAFAEEEVSTLPLGSSTFTRTFDELTLLLPGVAPPPQTLGSVAGPGIGAGVGSAGQFSVNGLRSRANNFTVDGSDNNDEDIGVRRQGFFSLVPQPIESIKEYQAITLLAP
ncbi:MAG TPA: carboxypeptidase-like regulatory domain-containing protein, partial [Pyrinomonadaceae bacterium]|nr:carboxypeptidase-like regulatory domain-containing protein [Pyrinomonadaceae bacterium]